MLAYMGRRTTAAAAKRAASCALRRSRLRRRRRRRRRRYRKRRIWRRRLLFIIINTLAPSVPAAFTHPRPFSRFRRKQKKKSLFGRSPRSRYTAALETLSRPFHRLHLRYLYTVPTCTGAWRLLWFLTVRHCPAYGTQYRVLCHATLSSKQ